MRTTLIRLRFLLPGLLLILTLQEISAQSLDQVQISDRQYSALSLESYVVELKAELGWDQTPELVPVRKYPLNVQTNNVQFRGQKVFVERFDQYHEGLKVWGGHWIRHVDSNDKIIKGLGSILKEIDVSVIPSIGEKSAISTALHEGNALAQESHRLLTENWTASKATLAIMDRAYPRISQEYILVYTCDISHPQDPSLAHRIFIDAHSGTTAYKEPLVASHRVPATVETQYQGSQDVYVDSIAPDHFELYDSELQVRVQTRFNGEIEDVVSPDNDWNFDSVHRQDAAADIHYGTSKYSQYMNENYGWDGVDGMGNEYVGVANEDFEYVNAYWNRNTQKAYFGDGNCADYGPLTTLEIVAHEFAHAFTEHTSGLIYADESGGLNEATSDILAKVIEARYEPSTFNWLIGGSIRIDPTADPFRDMEDPHRYGNAKMYGDTYWFDRNEVHNTSGVWNHWSYLLSDGGQGQNDDGIEYDVQPIGIKAVGDLVVYLHQAYMFPSITYNQVKSLSILAAEDLFGVGSVEVMSIKEANKAVGLYSSSDFSIRDLRIYHDESRRVVCANGAQFVYVILENQGTEDYLRGDSIRLSYYSEFPDIEEFETLVLQEDFLSGDQLQFAFSEPVGPHSTGYQRVRVFILSPDFREVNNTDFDNIRVIEEEVEPGIELHYAYWPQNNGELCGDLSDEPYRIEYRYVGCEELEEGSSIYVKLVFETGLEYDTVVVTTSNIDPFRFGAIDILDFKSLVESAASYRENVEFELKVALDVDSLIHDGFVSSILYSTFLDTSYVIDFESPTTSRENLILYNFRPDNIDLIQFDGSTALAFMQQQHLYPDCVDVENIIRTNDFNSHSLSLCIDSRGLAEPIFEFDATAFHKMLDGSTTHTQGQSVLFSVSIPDEYDQTYPIYQNLPEGTTETYQFRLPEKFNDRLSMDITLFSGHLVDSLMPDFTDGDFLIMDNLRLVDNMINSTDNPSTTDPFLQIYPNPVYQGRINMEVSPDFGLYHLTVFDAMGRMISQKQNLHGIFQWDVSSLLSGAYHATIRNDKNDQYSKTFVVMPR